MGNITLSLNDEREKNLRRWAKEKYRGRKGSMSRIVSEALDKFGAEGKREQARQRLIAGMKKGFHMGKILAKNRGEIYDRFDRK